MYYFIFTLLYFISLFYNTCKKISLLLNKLKLLMLGLCLTLNYNNSNVNASQNNGMHYNDVTSNNVVTNNDDVFNRRTDTLNSLIQKVNQEWKKDDKMDQKNVEFISKKLNWLKSGLEMSYKDGLDPKGAIRAFIGKVMPVIITMVSQDECDMWQSKLHSML